MSLDEHVKAWSGWFKGHKYVCSQINIFPNERNRKTTDIQFYILSRVKRGRASPAVVAINNKHNMSHDPTLFTISINYSSLLFSLF